MGDRLGYLAIAAAVLATLLIMRSDHDLGVAFGVVCIGVGGILAAVAGKPERRFSVNLVGMLIDKLPDGAWRVVTAVLGIGIASFGIWGMALASR